MPIKGDGFVMVHGRDVHASDCRQWPAWMWVARHTRADQHTYEGMPIGGRNVR